MQKKRPPTGKRISDHISPKYLCALGHFVQAWTTLQDSLGSLFWLALGHENGVLPYSVWHSVLNDRTQREMLRAASAVAFRGNMRAQEDIEWLLNRVDELANHRNDVIHAPYAITLGPDGLQLIPDWVTGNPRAAKLKDKELIAEFTWGREYARELTGFARQLCAHLRRKPTKIPWPDRPKSPLRVTNQSRKESNRRKCSK